MRRVTIRDFIKKKREGEKIVMITAYDYMTAKILDKLDIDGVLVGDSLGMVLLGYETTLPVTMEDMLHHTRAVARARPRQLIVGDMPFMSYQPSVSMAVENAGKFIKAGADAVKVEGGFDVADKIEAILKAGIPVMGHIGLTPQWVHRFGGYRLMGKEHEAAVRLDEEAKMLEELGVFSIVIEFTTSEVANEITKRLNIPTIGIGCGSGCDGQIIVINDIIGLSPFIPSFAKKYADVGSMIEKAVSSYIDEVKNGKFPGEEHTRYMSPEEYKAFIEALKKRDH
jgi:3-methyl-2-oxobutanoate hydroxymethyltransferase